MSESYSLVTGASSGIGLESCYYLLDEGYKVFGASRSGSPIDHENYFDVVIDLKKQRDVENLFCEIQEEVDALDVVIQAAGVFEISALEDLEYSQFKNMLETNVLAPFNVFKHSIDTIKKETHFITVHSVASQKGFPNVSAYCASKYALKGLVDSLKEEWSEKGCRFSDLYPGPIDTPMWDEVMDEFGDFDKEHMLSLDDYISVLDMVIKSPSHMQFPNLTFLHQKGGLAP